MLRSLLRTMLRERFEGGENCLARKSRAGGGKRETKPKHPSSIPAVFWGSEKLLLATSGFSHKERGLSGCRPGGHTMILDSSSCSCFGGGAGN